MRARLIKNYALIITLTFIAMLLFFVGYFSYVNRLSIVEENKKHNLEVVTQFKIQHIRVWQRERFEFGNSIINNLFVVNNFHKMVSDKNLNKAVKDEYKMFDYLQKNLEYYNYVLLNKDLVNVYSTGRVDSRYKELINYNTDSIKVTISDFYKDSLGNMYLSVIIPLHNENRLFGWLVTEVKPEDELNPFILFSPGNLNIFETYLALSGEDSTVVRFSKETLSGKKSALAFEEYNPALHKAINLGRGFLNEVYNGKGIILYVDKVPESSWHVISSISYDEVKAEAFGYLKTLFVILGLVFLISALTIIIVWRNYKLKFYKKQYEFEKEKNILLAHYSYLTRYANDMIILTDENCIIKLANEKAINVYGYSKEEFIGMNVKNIITPAQAEGIEQLKENVKKDNGLIFETEHVKSSGERFPVEISARYFEIDGSSFFQTIIRDISEKKIKEEELRRHSIMLNSVGQAIIITDPEGTIIYWNRAAETLYGWKKEEVIGNDAMVVTSPNLTEEQIVAMRDKFSKNEIWTGECSIQKKDKTYFPALVSISAIYDNENKFAAILCLVTDITGQKERQQELIIAKEKAEEVNRIKTNFLANMSHELRTPLIGILGYAEYIKEEYCDPDLKEKADIIYKSGIRLNETLNTILDLSKIEAEKVDVTSERVNLCQLVDECVTLYKLMAHDKGISINYFSPSKEICIDTDKKLFSRVMNNLLSNAVKFTDKGEIKVYSQIENSTVKINVEDSGIGIPADKIDLIFEPFRQVSEGYNRKFEGTGLGLTITRMLTGVMKGSLKVKSQPGKGSTFTVELPYMNGKTNLIGNQERKETSKILDNPEKQKKINILLVEDDEVNAKIILRFLEESYNAEWVKSGNEAIDMALKKKFDCFLMDISLKGELDGLMTTERIKKIPGYQSVPVVAVTAYAMVGDKERFLSSGCSHYISKPFSKKELLHLLVNVFEGSPE